MRADRWLALLMLLQGRGRMTARQLADELEVSERTIYRDIDALGVAGVLVYSEIGREGGYALLDSYRTSLTGMTDGEVQALFMLNTPEPLTALGLGQELKAALLKLSASLPDGRRDEEARVRQRFHLDSTWWVQGEEPVPYLRTIYRAVWEDRQITLLVDPHNIQEMKDSIWKILSDKRLSGSLSEKGLQQAKRFSWFEAAEKVKAIYESL